MPNEDGQLQGLLSGEDLEGKYNQINSRVRGLLSGMIRSNPAVTNYTLSMANDPGMTELPDLWGNLTNIPNAMVIDAHGRTNQPAGSLSNPEGHFGLRPNLPSGGTNELAAAVEERQKLLQNRSIFDQAPTYGGFSLEEVAKALPANATNEIKTLILSACYRAGYSPEDVRKYFPNVAQVIASDPGSSTSLLRARSLFYREPDPWDVENPHPPKLGGKLGTNFILQNYQGGSTNPIHQASDWIPNPPANFPYQEHMGELDELE